VAELELEGRAAEGVCEHLVAEADAEDRVVRNQIRDRLVDVGQGGGIPGAVGEEDGVGPVFTHLLAGRGGREDLHLEAVVHELAVDGVLGAEVEGGDAELLRRDRGRVHRRPDGEVRGVVVRRIAGAPDEGCLAGDVLYVVGAGHVLPRFRALDGLGVGYRQRAKAALHRAVDAEFFREGTGVDFADAGNTVLA